MPVKRPPNTHPEKPAKKKTKSAPLLSDDPENPVSESSEEDNANPTSHHHEDEKV